MTKREAEERVKELEGICYKQRDTLASQQETIVQLNITNKSMLVAFAEKFGDGENKAVEFSKESFDTALDRFEPSVEKTDDCYRVTLAKV